MKRIDLDINYPTPYFAAYMDGADAQLAADRKSIEDAREKAGRWFYLRGEYNRSFDDLPADTKERWYKLGDEIIKVIKGEDKDETRTD